MLALLGLVFFSSSVFAAHHTHAPATTQKPKTDHELIHDLLAENQKLMASLDYMKTSTVDLTRQVMLQQSFVEERIRSDGSSGLKQVRNVHDGTRPYYSVSTASGGVAGLHEHANNIRTVGMGELNVVLNGVEFRTRHNDYRLRMPSHNKNYNELVDVPYPDVPPAVLAKKTVAEQITEMREWFLAFKNQDYSVRDYRKYFKPVLTYLEGGWTTNTKTLEEPFFSDRHHIDASNWFDLQDKIRFTSYSGGKSTLENFAYLPTTIMNVVNGTPEYAQWNYRIAVHPLKDDLPLSSFKIQDDLSERMKRKLPLEKMNNTRVARYALTSKLLKTQHAKDRYHDGSYHWGLLDDLMYQIPGKDNYPGVIRDNAYGNTLYHIHSTPTNMQTINSARYHRWYKIDEKDAMGSKIVHRGFADSNLFVAQTTNPKIAGLTSKFCKTIRDNVTHHRHKECSELVERFTYAIPLEIVYMTPLLTWNPYNLELKTGSHVSSVTKGPSGPRNGQMTQEKAYNGTQVRYYYRTPTEFFSSTGSVDHDRADTAKGAVGVLDRNGVIRKVVASGNRIIIPAIESVGKVRTRWPIVPLHAEGQHTRKELEALKDMVMRMPTYSSLFEEMPTSVSHANQVFMEQEHLLKVPETTRDPPGLHAHDILIHQYDIEDLKKGHTIKGLLTSVANGHQHSVDIRMNGTEYVMVSCDGLPHCWDGHGSHLTFES